jgi:Fe-S cluster biogenesis protein NfuA/nitrite reductase/ring-hydroxylating ferredoxin subunit
MEDRELIGRVDGLLAELEALSDAAARGVALETVQAVLELYGAGLGRIVAGVGRSTTAELAGDELVEHLLLLHGLHPVSVEQRVRAALDGVRPYLGSHGGGVDLLGVSDGVAMVRLQGSCEGCPASAMTLKLAIEDAVLKAVPDVERVEADTSQDSPGSTGDGPLLQIEVVRASEPDGAWAQAGALPQLAGGGLLLKEIVGEPVLFLRLPDGTPYAYRPDCPGCGEPLAAGTLQSAGLVGAELQCAGCQHSYDVVRAGRCVDTPDLHLEPVPLLVDESGLVRVALRAGVA